jgi:hypothetical protein
MNKYSNWLIYQGEKASKIKAISYKDIEKNLDRPITFYERSKILEFRDYVADFFGENSSKPFFWNY